MRTQTPGMSTGSNATTSGRGGGRLPAIEICCETNFVDNDDYPPNWTEDTGAQQ